MRKILITLALAAFIVSLTIPPSAAKAIESPADLIGREVKIYLKQCEANRTGAGGRLKSISAEWYIVERVGTYYLIPVSNIALIES